MRDWWKLRECFNSPLLFQNSTFWHFVIRIIQSHPSHALLQEITDSGLLKILFFSVGELQVLCSSVNQFAALCAQKRNTLISFFWEYEQYMLRMQYPWNSYRIFLTLTQQNRTGSLFDLFTQAYWTRFFRHPSLGSTDKTLRKGEATSREMNCARTNKEPTSLPRIRRNPPSSPRPETAELPTRATSHHLGGRINWWQRSTQAHHGTVAPGSGVKRAAMPMSPHTVRLLGAIVVVGGNVKVFSLWHRDISPSQHN